MTILFSKHHKDLTVFENPVYLNCSLNINGKNFPDENVSTISARFFESQLTVGDFDTITFSYTKKFEDSMTILKYDANRVRYKTTISYATSFVFFIQTKSANSGYTFNNSISVYGMIIHK